MKILVVFAHPRRDSLSGLIADRFVEGLNVAGHEVEFADLQTEGFDPVLRIEDEPDWEDGSKKYSADVEQEMDRIRRNDATVMIFPVWWWSMPAILKGWIDRVWNHGFGYTFAEGSSSYPHEHALMIGVAGNDQASYEKRDYDRAAKIQLDTGILEYCAIKNHGLAMYYDSLSGNTSLVEEQLDSAKQLGADFPNYENLPGDIVKR